MLRELSRWLLVSVLLCWPLLAESADLTFHLRDSDGRPIADAVVSLTGPQASPAAVGEPLVVDQSDETFIPLVTVVPRGGQVVFRNSDITRHHVYSFSPPKPFELVVAPGESSSPVRFDQPGVVVLGCNIHDQMIAYLYVSATRLTGVSGADGTVVLSGVPAGSYIAHVWHPRQRPGRPDLEQPLEVAAADQTVDLGLALLARMPGMPGMTMQPRDRERSRY